MNKNAETPEKSDFMTWKTFQRNETLQEQTFMVRKQYVEMIQYLKQINWPEQDLTKFVLWGKIGTGKTLTLSQIFHFAYKSNYIVIHLPKLKHWFRQYTGVSCLESHIVWIQFQPFYSFYSPPNRNIKLADGICQMRPLLLWIISNISTKISWTVWSHTRLTNGQKCTSP